MGAGTEVQLRSQGFLTEEEPTGYFGAQTEAALRKWQARRGLRSGSLRRLSASSRRGRVHLPAAAPLPRPRRAQAAAGVTQGAGVFGAASRAVYAKARPPGLVAPWRDHACEALLTRIVARRCTAAARAAAARLGARISGHGG